MSINGLNILKQVTIPAILAVSVLIIGLAVMKNGFATQATGAIGTKIASFSQSLPAISPASGE